MPDLPVIDSLMKFSSADVAPAEGFGVWRELVSRCLLKVDIDRLDDGPYQVDAKLRMLPQLRVGVGAMSAALHHRPRGATRDENDDIAMLINLRGTLVIRGRGEDVTVGAGDGFLIRCNEPGAYVNTESGASLVIRLKPETMGVFAAHAVRADGLLVPAATEALQLLTPYAMNLARGRERYLPATTQTVTQHVADLLALVVGADGDRAHEARGRGVAAARLAAAKTYVRERLSHGDLSEQAAAAQQGVSDRYLRRLFAAVGETFAGYVREQRLAHAHLMLTSPRFAASTISSIAFEVGFGDLSYFNHSFRRRFERTPREARAEAIRRWRVEEEGG
jgi:AraC-like DNA-binding protein